MASFDLGNKQFEKNKTPKARIIGISLVVFCSLVFIFLFTSFVPAIRDFFLGVFGLFAYPLFIVAFTIGIALINNKKYVMPVKYIVFVSAAIVAFLALLNLIILGKPDCTFWEYLALSYTFKYTGGGILVSLLVAPILYLLGLAGAIIIFSAVLIVFVALIIDFLHSIKLYGKDSVTRKKPAIEHIEFHDDGKTATKQEKKAMKLQKKIEKEIEADEEFELFKKTEDDESFEAKRKLGLIEGNLASEEKPQDKAKSIREYLLTPPEVDLTPYQTKPKQDEIENNIDRLKQDSQRVDNVFSSDFKPSYAQNYTFEQTSPVQQAKKEVNEEPYKKFIEKTRKEAFGLQNSEPETQKQEARVQQNHHSSNEKPKRNFAQLQIDGTEKYTPPELKNVYRRPPTYFKPPMELLEKRETDIESLNEDVVRKRIQLENALETFGINAKVIGVVVGPAVTRYELEMPPGVSVKRIVNYKDDIALALASRGGLRIETPIPGRSAVGIEIPNDKIAMVGIRDIIESPEFTTSKSIVSFALGKDINGDVFVCNLAKMPHLLVAGATNSGKSIFLNALIISMIYKSSPDDLRLILIDPKRVKFSMYNDLPHLVIPNVITDTEKANNALTWAINEMERRFEIVAEERLRNIEEYNNSADVLNGIKPKLPYIVIVIDEFNDLMSVMKKDIEEKVKRLAQKARAAGIHLVLATQRPSVDVITGTIKSNFPSRISFALTSFADSKTILDQAGAENLLGKGDMLYLPSDANSPRRIQGCYVSNEEVNSVVEFVKEHTVKEYDDEIAKFIDNPNKDEEREETHEFIEQRLDMLSIKCLKFIIENGQASMSSLQRRFSIGFNRAGRIIDLFTKKGYISKQDGQKPRDVYMTMEEFENLYGEVEI